MEKAGSGVVGPSEFQVELPRTQRRAPTLEQRKHPNVHAGCLLPQQSREVRKQEQLDVVRAGDQERARARGRIEAGSSAEDRFELRDRETHGTDERLRQSGQDHLPAVWDEKRITEVGTE